ncbi:Putative peptide ABC transporter permease protein [Kitasatospora sp. MMS16-BH015]|uniref:ABC transporter permease n=1 Tax=Kitasatospora sp. MMS16-BH015 TaxID=2018025 RepID=UPI000CA0ED96|nr:ABC transporter permease [Kitasatospora sp. MMS16-BH015]AUG76179.1 Putative peptide ABC transporter permease protein [Kitasatospora sp. MMS16-BH015]
MIGFLIRRLLGIAVTLLVICALTFTIFYLLPNDPAVQFCGKDCTTDRIELVRQQMGLADPLYIQFGRYVLGIFAGQTMGSGQYAVHCGFPCFGYSFQSAQPVWSLMMDRLPASASLALGASVLWLLIGLSAGVLSALRRNTWVDRTVMVGTIGIAALPVYFTAMVLLYLVVSVLGWMPYPRYIAFTQDPVAWIRNLILPWITLALMYAAIYARMTRNSVIETMEEPYVRTARAKGMRERRVVAKHGLRPALTPVATMLGMDLGGLLAGALITESLFSLPGVGKLFADSLNKADQPVVMGITMLAAFFIVTSNLIVDLVYAWIDPRARLT